MIGRDLKSSCLQPPPEPCQRSGRSVPRGIWFVQLAFFPPMETEPILETAIREARSLLWANWPPVHNLPDAETVARLSDIISSSAVVRAVRRSDTFFAFVLRAIRRALADHSQTDRQVITSLWSIFDDPDLNGALDIPRNRPQRSCHERQNEAEMRNPTGRSQNWRPWVLTPQGGRSHDIFGFRRRPRRHA